MKLTISIVLISALVLGYGYWYSKTHGSAHINLVFKTSTGIKREAVPGTEVFFLNATGDVLATGISDRNANFIHLIHPEAGDCHDVSRDLWQECFQQQAVWIPQWIRNISQVDVNFKNCSFSKIPLTISESNSDWFLWWIPHPHIGGLPYSYFWSTIELSETEFIKKQCKDRP